MEVLSVSPLRTASLLWQAKPGAWIFTVICKATFVLSPTESPLAPEQEEPNEEDTHWDDDPARSLHSATDLVPFKIRADVALVGHVFAPGKRPARSVVARMVIGDVDKAIEAVCDRWFTQDGRLHEGSPFARMSLGYERAFGGPGTSNPVGVRRDVRDAYGKSPVPNLQPPGMIISSPGDSFDPIGFGPIAPSWPTRREKLGRHAANPSARALLATPLPEDIDPSFWNAAPLDQQLNALRNNERLVLENLHPEHPRMVTSLPGVSPRAYIDGRPGGALELPMNADTLFIDTDRALCSMTWRGSFQLEHMHERGRVIVGMEQPGKPLSWAEAERIIERKKIEKPAPPSPATSTAPLGIPQRSSPVPAPPLPAPPMHAGAAPQIPAPPITPPSAPAPPPLYIAEVAASWGTAAPPPPVGAMPAAPPAGEPKPGWSNPSLPAVPKPPPSTRSSPTSPTFRVPTPATPSSPGIDSPWASGGPPPLPSKLSMPVAPAPALAPKDAAQTLSSSREAPDAAVLVASNAAAARSAPWDKPRTAEMVADEVEPEPDSEPVVEARAESSDLVELIWFDPESVPRIRRQLPWRAILDEMEERPADADLEETTPSRSAAEAEDRRDVFEILARGGTMEAGGFHDALDKAVRGDGKFVPPLALVSGDLVFPFDEAETLKAYIAAATPLASTDENLKSSIALAKEFLSSPGLVGSPGVAEGLIARMKEAFSMAKRPVPFDYLETQSARALLEKRCYQRRDLFGSTYLRCLFHTAAVTGVSAKDLANAPAAGAVNMNAGGGNTGGAAGSGSAPSATSPQNPSGPVPAYIPESLAKNLPLFQRFKVRMIAEIHLALDQIETHPLALKSTALARAVARPLRR